MCDVRALGGGIIGQDARCRHLWSQDAKPATYHTKTRLAGRGWLLWGRSRSLQCSQEGHHICVHGLQARMHIRKHLCLHPCMCCCKACTSCKPPCACQIC
jgi:hypothetical protein